MRGLLLLLTLLAGLAQADTTLRVLNWKDYIEPEVLERFKAEHAVRIDYQTFTSADELDRLLDAGTPYDLIVPSHFQLTRLIDSGRLLRLDKFRLSHYDNLDPKLLASLAAFSRANDYVVPYLWTTVGLVTDDAKLAERLGETPADSWSVLFDPTIANRLSDCGIGWIDAPEEIFSLWLNYRGKQLGRASPRALERYARRIGESASRVGSLNNDAYVDGLAKGQLCVAMAWAGHAITAAQQRPSLRYRIPREGGLLTIDSWAIPANAGNPELAHRFIDFMLMAPVAVRNTQATGFYSPMKTTLAEMEALAIADARLVPTAAARQRLYFLEQLSPDQKAVIDREWSRLKQDRAPDLVP